jgi:hypothetical protein
MPKVLSLFVFIQLDFADLVFLISFKQKEQHQKLLPNFLKTSSRVKF